MYSSDSEFEKDAEEKEIELYTQFYFGNDTNNTKINDVNCQKGVAITQDKCNQIRDLANSKEVRKNICNKEVTSDNKTQETSQKYLDNKKNEILLKSQTQKTQRRRRLSSICSLDSISGKEPLDSLYCNDFLDDDLSTVPEEDIANKFNSDEESCYNILLYKKGDGSKNKISSDKEVTIIPADTSKVPTKNIIVENLCSSSDESIKIINIKKVKKLKSNISTNFVVNTSPPKRKKLNHCKSNVTPNRDESDTDDITLEEIKLYKLPLITNLRSAVRTSFTNSRLKKNPNKKLQFTKSQVIFSKGRPQSTRQPTCPKWTKEMTSFYDSDYSDEFSVEDIHSTQSSMYIYFLILIFL